MGEPFIGEIRLFSFNWNPRDWALCDGSLLSIAEHQALFALISNQFGGDGRTNFALPDLRGRSPLHIGTLGHFSYETGQRGGTEQVALVVPEMPLHTHALEAVNASGNQSIPTGNVPAISDATAVYTPESNPVQMASEAISSQGGTDGHENMQPFLVLNFCISLQGAFPPRN